MTPVDINNKLQCKLTGVLLRFNLRLNHPVLLHKFNGTLIMPASLSAQQAMMTSWRIDIPKVLQTPSLAPDAPAQRGDSSLKDANELRQEGHFVYSPSDKSVNPLDNAPGILEPANAPKQKKRKQDHSALEGSGGKCHKGAKPSQQQQPLDRVLALKDDST
jgi:hypothetical protein